jgi:hypothetical protein
MAAEATPVPQIKPFGAVVQEQRNGLLHSELSEKLADLVGAVLEHEKPGALTLTIKVTPNKDGSSLLVTDDVKVKAPAAPRRPSVFFADSHGNLSRRDPRQPELPLRELRGGATPTSTPTSSAGSA